MTSQACGQTSDARTSPSAVAPIKTIASNIVNRRRTSGPMLNSSIISDICQFLETTVRSDPLQGA